jgi:hypothetical protein
LPLLQEDLLAVVNWGPVSLEWLEIEAAEFPENPGRSTENRKRDSESAENAKT